MGKRKETHYHYCYDCKNAQLVKYTGDPVIAECEVNHEKQVASTLLDCSLFKQRFGEAVIEQRKKRLGLSNIWI